MTAPPIDPTQPQMLQPPVMPWTPFQRLPTDTEPLIAAERRRRLGRLIDSAKFESFPPEWQAVAIREYEEMRAVEAAAAQPMVQQEGQPTEPQPPTGAPPQ